MSNKTYKALAGTSETVFTLAFGTQRIGIRTNAGAIEFQNNGGAWVAPTPNSWTSDFYTIDAGIIALPELTLAHIPLTNTEMVFYRGLKLRRGAHYTIAANVITLSQTLTLGDTVEVMYPYQV